MKNNLSLLDKEIGVLRDPWSSNYTQKDILWTLRQMNAWAMFLDKIGLASKLKTKVLVKIAVMSATDLLDKLSNKSRINKIEKLLANLEQLDQFTDPNGTAFNSFEESDVILNSLYKEIGFT